MGAPQITSSPSATRSYPIIVCGMGHVGTCVVRLLRRLDLPVVVITRPAREDWLRGVRALGARVLIGDARDSKLLQEAGLAQAVGLISVTDQDIVNIEIALDARRQRPDLPVVVRLFDTHLGRSLETSLGLRRAVGVSTLVAPAFAAAVFGEHLVGAFALHHQGGADATTERWVIGRLPSGGPLIGLSPEDLRERYGAVELDPGEAALPALAAETSNGTPAQLGPRYLLGQEDGFQRLVATTHTADGGVLPGRTRTRPRRRRSSFLREAWGTAPASLRKTFLVLLLLIGLSVFVFRAALHLSLLDAFYFIITTVTTTGYGDITPRGSGPLVQLYACVMMLLGSAMTATVYSFVTDLLITERLRAVLGRPRMPEGDHVIVVGLGNVGHRVVEKLVEAGVAVVAVNSDSSRDFVKAAQVPVIIGDARLPSVLREAGAETAAALIAATGDEAVNLGVGLAAKALRPTLRTVVRLFAADLASKVKHGLRVDAALSAANIAAPTFVAALLDEAVLEAFEVEGALLCLCRRQVGPSWDGLRAAEVAARDGVQVVLRRHSEGYRPVLPEDRLAQGEHALVLLRRPLGPQ